MYTRLSFKANAFEVSLHLTNTGDLMAEKPHINLITTGHVDHGKSTLIGRLLYDSGSIPEQDLRKLKEKAKELKKETFEFAFVIHKLR